MNFSTNPESVARLTLNQLADIFELADLEVELADTELTVFDDRGQTFLLNFHLPTNQLWLSSPATGAHHFVWKEGIWLSTRSVDKSLTAILSADIFTVFQKTLIYN